MCDGGGGCEGGGDEGAAAPCDPTLPALFAFWIQLPNGSRAEEQKGEDEERV